jgi:hypothetical protein
MMFEIISLFFNLKWKVFMNAKKILTKIISRQLQNMHCKRIWVKQGNKMESCKIEFGSVHDTYNIFFI